MCGPRWSPSTRQCLCSIVTITDTFHSAGVLQAITSRIPRIVRCGKNEGSGCSQRPGPQHRPWCRPYYMWRDLWAWTTASPPSCAWRRGGGADNQGAGEQAEQGGRICIKVIDHDPQGPSSPKSLERTAMKKVRKIKVMRPKVSSHLTISTTAISTTNQTPKKPCATRWQRDKRSPSTS